MVATGCTVYPPIVALCIQVGWVLGEVKDEYLFRDKASYQYTGRCNSFLDQPIREFSDSPPYFYFTELCEIEKLYFNRKFCQFLETRIPRYTSISSKTNILKMCCFAKICFHNEKLKRHAP